MGKLDEKIIVKFLAGECSEEELRSLNVWLEESEENAHELFTLEELYHWENPMRLLRKHSLRRLKNNCRRGSERSGSVS